MTGWNRLRLVLSVIYWTLALFLAWSVAVIAHATDAAMAFVALAVFVYAALAGIWWALTGFGRPTVD